MTLQSPIPASAPAPVADVFRDGRFETDSWTRLADEAEIPAAGGVLLPLARFLAEERDGRLGNGPIGVILAPADRVGDLVPHLGRLAVIAVDFPRFNDGRGFSHATLVRRAGFGGELRAIGNVLIDQIDFMRRVGFTAFQVSHAVTRRYLSEGRNPAPVHYYQPSVIIEPPAGTRPWQRRAGDR